MMKRLALAAIVAAALSLTLAVGVLAKMPFFTVTVDPSVPTAGEPFLVVVRTWDDVAHLRPAGFSQVGAMSGLLVARQSSGGSPDITIPLVLRAPDRFEATVTLPAGDWTLVAFPDRSGWGDPNVPVGYPDTIPLTIRQPMLNGAGLAVALAVVVVAILALTQMRFSPRFGRQADPTPSFPPAPGRPWFRLMFHRSNQGS
jgi:hypothetical protein